MARSGLLHLLDKNYQNSSPLIMGYIDEEYIGGKPKVLWDDGKNMTDKTYSYLDSYTPMAGDRVIGIKNGNKIIILGKIADSLILS